VESGILTRDRAETHALWSPRGESILFQLSDGIPTITPGFSIEVRRADGSGEPARIYRSGDEEFGMLSSWSKSGSYVLFQTGVPGEAQQIWALRLNDAHQVEERLSFGVSGQHAVISPDMELVAYTSAPIRGVDGSQAVYVAAFPDATGRVLVSPESGRNPQWSASGRELYYLDNNHYINVAGIEQDTTGQVRVRSNSRLFQITGNLGGVGEFRRFAVAPDAESFVVVEPARGAEAPAIRLVMNWAERVDP
jgi:Tol biopolymer transport system component